MGIILYIIFGAIVGWIARHASFHGKFCANPGPAASAAARKASPLAVISGLRMQ